MKRQSGVFPCHGMAELPRILCGHERGNLRSTRLALMKWLKRGRRKKWDFETWKAPIRCLSSNHKRDLFDPGYVGYTQRQPHQRVEEHKRSAIDLEQQGKVTHLACVTLLLLLFLIYVTHRSLNVIHLPSRLPWENSFAVPNPAYHMYDMWSCHLKGC